MLAIRDFKNRISSIINEVEYRFKYDKQIPMHIFVGDHPELKEYCLKNNIDGSIETASLNAQWYTENFKLTEYHILFNYNFWKKSDYIELKGGIVHELQHAEIYNVFPETIYDNSVVRSSTFGSMPLEMITDLLCVVKGFTREIIYVRRYLSVMSKVIRNCQVSDCDIHNFHRSDGLNLNDIIRLYDHNNNRDLISDLL